MKKYRVIQWGTGQVGKGSLRGILENPQLELVGVAVYSPEKNGVDAGELCGMPPTGIKATTDHASLLAMQADCVNFNADGFGGDPVIEKIEAILLSGKNVGSTSVLRPSKNVPGRLGDVATIKRFETACQQAGVSYYCSGIDPGFATNELPLLVSGMCQGIDSVRVQEICDYSSYNSPHALVDFNGFGKPIPKEAPKWVAEVWTSALTQLAEGLGVELDDIVLGFEGRLLERDVDVLGLEFKKGTMGAQTFSINGRVNGKTVVTIEHITRIDPTLAPDWPQPPGYDPAATEPQGGYIIYIGGKLRYKLSLEFYADGGDFMMAGCWATGMRIVNAIPAICTARTGVLSTNEIPIITGRGLVKTA
jgi:4-hydroxy-tetrahydrodipicolinate reductase